MKEKTKLRTRFIAISAAIIALYLTITLALYVKADSLIFRPPQSSYIDTQDSLKLNSGGKQISATYLKNSNAKYTILYSHGNAEDIGQNKKWLKELSEEGFSVLAYDYQGFGTSEGMPTESNSYSDIEAAYLYLVNDLKIPPVNIIVYGFSVGSGPSVELATKHQVGALILQSPFTSAFKVVFTIRLLPFDKFENLKKLKNVGVPLLVIHGTADKVIPFSHGVKIYNEYQGDKQFLWLEGLDHNDIQSKGRKEIFEAIKKFILLF